MTWIDWLIVILPMTFIIGIAVYSRKYARSVTDYMAAGRVAGRYLMSVGDLTAQLSILTLIAGAEATYQTGFAVSFWQNILAPVAIILGLTGYCTYRWRETRCLSRGQFLELRYGSKTFRLVTAFLSSVAEIITNAISPAIAANFFIYYLKLPHEIMILGVNLPCYVIIVASCLILAIILIWPSGRISLLITDAVQGILCYPIFVMIAGFILLKFSWNIDIIDVLCDRVPEQSYLDPYDIRQLKDFNLFALVVTLTSSILNRAVWFGNDTTSSGRTPHEQKMAGLLGSWRSGFAFVMITLLAVITIAFMNSSHFATHTPANGFRITNNEIRKELSAKVLKKVVTDQKLQMEVIKKVKMIPDQVHTIGIAPPLSQQQNLDSIYFQTVQEALGDTPDGRHMFQEYRSVFQQMLMPSLLREIFPVGLLGLFCLLMIMLLVSTDDSRLFNVTGTLVQDMVLPCYTFFCKKRLSPKIHLLILRLTLISVALLFFVIAVFFRNLDYINMFTTIISAFWVAGSGPVMVFGLYSRFGNLTGAWCSMILGSGISFVGLLCQQNWTKIIYPWLENNGLVNRIDSLLRQLSSPFSPWISWRMDPYKFPINSYEIFFLSMISATAGYIIASFLTYKPYDLDRLLHRGNYAESVIPEVKTTWSCRRILNYLLSITPEYTKGDRIMAWGIFFYSIVYQLGFTFAGVLICNCFYRWPEEWWGWYFYIVILLIPGIIGIFTTVWFMWGGIADLKRLFHDLENRKIDFNDNGQVLESDQIIRNSLEESNQ